MKANTVIGLITLRSGRTLTLRGQDWCLWLCPGDTLCGEGQADLVASIEPEERGEDQHGQLRELAAWIYSRVFIARTSTCVFASPPYNLELF